VENGRGLVEVWTSPPPQRNKLRSCRPMPWWWWPPPRSTFSASPPRNAPAAAPSRHPCQWGRAINSRQSYHFPLFPQATPPLIKVHPLCLFHARIEVHPGPPKIGPNRSPPPFLREIEGKTAKRVDYCPNRSPPLRAQKVCH